MTQRGDVVVIARVEYEVLFDGRQALLPPRPEGSDGHTNGSSLAMAAARPLSFQRVARRYVRATPSVAISTT